MDMNRRVDPLSGSDYVLDKVYRVNPADRDQGKAGQDKFRDLLNQKNQKRSDEDKERNQDDPNKARDDEGAKDRVLISTVDVVEPESAAPLLPVDDSQNEKPPPSPPPSDEPPPRINITA